MYVYIVDFISVGSEKGEGIKKVVILSLFIFICGVWKWEWKWKWKLGVGSGGLGGFGGGCEVLFCWGGGDGLGGGMLL